MVVPRPLYKGPIHIMLSNCLNYSSNGVNQNIVRQKLVNDISLNLCLVLCKLKIAKILQSHAKCCCLNNACAFAMCTRGHM